MKNEELPTIGIVAPTGEAETFMCLLPHAIWRRYRSVQGVSAYARRDELDILIIDSAYLIPHTAGDRLRSTFSCDELDIVEILSMRFPILVLLDPTDDIPWLSELEGIAVVRRPVTCAGLLDSLARQEYRIRIARLWRLFQKVAGAYCQDVQWRVT